MNSVWLNVADNESSNSQSIRAPFLGVFTDDPANIAASLSRPITPFPNKNPNFISHYDAFISSFENDSKDINYNKGPSFAESPPRNVSLGIDGKNKKIFELNVFS